MLFKILTQTKKMTNTQAKVAFREAVTSEHLDFGRKTVQAQQDNL